MISFLNGFILPALFAATIPLILHFLSRKKARKIPFSSIKFLKVIENQRIKRVKLYQILLILVRTFFIIFLVLAFSRPTISTYSGGTSNAQTTAFIVLDDSYSMQSFAYSKTYFEMAKEKALELLSLFSNEDKVFLITSSMEKPISVNKDNIQQTLTKLQTANTSFNLAKALSKADSIFNKFLNLNNELYILSDFKIQAQESDTISFNKINNFQAYKLQIGMDIPFKNISIDTVLLESQFYEMSKPFDISVQLTNHDKENTETNLNLYNGDERVSMEYVALQANESKIIKIKYIPKIEGTHFLKLQIDEDDLSFDNNWYFSFFMRDEIKTLFVADNKSESIKTALKILSDNTIFKFTTVRFNEWQGTNLDNYDLVILDDLKNIDENAVSGLKNYTRSDHSLVIIPGGSISIENYNTFFNSMINRSMFTSLQNAESQGFFSIENQKTANIIFDALFRDKNSTFTPPKVYKYFKQNNFDDALIRLSNNDPFITQTGSLIVFSSSFDNSWSDMEINGLFLPLLYRSFYHAAQNRKPLSDMQSIGINITFRIRGTTIDKNYTIQNPAGKKYSVIPKPINNSLIFDGGKSTDDGFYILLDNAKPIATKAVNHSSKELRKPYLNDSDFVFDIESLEKADFSKQIESARLGFELWIFCIVFAFLMVIVEMILIKIIEGTPFLRKT